VAKTFEEVDVNINAELNRLERDLSRVEPTLAESLVNRRRKIAYHISNLRTKFHNAQMRKDKVIKHQIETAFTSLVPNRHLQERTLNANSFINLHGLYLIDWIYQAIDLDDKGHRIIYL
jgi:carbonic anhydrase